MQRLRIVQLLFFLLCFYAANSIAKPWVFVRWVNDGDTIVLNDGLRVRYLGINAPEIDHEGKPAELLGYQALNFNKQMVFLKQVRLEYDTGRFDQYGRLLAYVFLKDATFVNRAMLNRGYAYFLHWGTNVRYNDLLLLAQRKAMSAGKGIWSSWKESDERYAGNRRSKRFHRAACRYGKKIAKRNRVVFSRRRDAFWEGFAPCKICIAREHNRGDAGRKFDRKRGGGKLIVE